MNHKPSSLAITCGLSGLAAWAHPTLAVANPIVLHSSEPLFYAAMGAVAGVSVASLASVMLVGHMRRDMNRRIDELEARLDAELTKPAPVGRHAAGAEGASYSLAAMRERRDQEEVRPDPQVETDLTPAPDQQAVSDQESASDEKSAAAVVEAEPEPVVAVEAAPQAAVLADVAVAPEVEAQSRPDAMDVDVDPAAAVPAPVVAAEPARPAEPAPIAPEPEAARTSRPEPTKPAAQEHSLHRKAKHQGKDGMHTAVELNLEDVAATYIEKKSFRERMITLSRGVSTVLAERLSPGSLDDVPMIQRADGTIADLGTGWWEQKAAKRELEISRDFGSSFAGAVAASASQYTAASLSGQYPQTSALASHTPSSSPAAQPQAAASSFYAHAPLTRREQACANFDEPFDFASAKLTAQAKRAGAKAAAPAADPARNTQLERAVDIARRVAPVDGDIYPEQPSAAAYKRDAWEIALAALDEHFDDNLMSELVPFTDFVGGAETIDEPDGLERSTRVLGFKYPAGHPEVYDTGSYISYLVLNEFKANGTVAGEQARRFFKVIDGGSLSAMRPLKEAVANRA